MSRVSARQRLLLRESRVAGFMARAKHVARKLRLAAALKSNEPTPVWVTVKTRLRVRRPFRLRHWRRVKLKNI